MDRRNEYERSSSLARRNRFFNRMDRLRKGQADRRCGGIMDEIRVQRDGKLLLQRNGQRDVAAMTDPGDPLRQNRACGRVRRVVTKDDAGISARQLVDGHPEPITDALIAHEPEPRPCVLASFHCASYSLIMSSAADQRQQILDRIRRAAELAKRDFAEVELIAVSKGRTAAEIEALIAAGQRDFGENRVQEAQAKWPPLLARHPDIRLHGIGRLQSNKAAEAVQLFEVIHSLDRPSLLEALVKEAQKSGRFPSLYVQVNVGEEEQKGGCRIRDAGALIEAVRASPLPLAGLMAIPPFQLEPSPYFALLAKLARRHDVTGLSIGMSGDFEAAVMLGATAVRVGSALFED